jgi:sugar/nucleoside kinase (ribokinase family)
MSSQVDVLSVGDVVTDVFIKLFDEQAHSYENEHGKWLAVPFGMKIPFERVEILEAVGNAANASVSFARLGLKSGLVSNVGGDQHGRDMISTLHNQRVDTRFIRINPGKKSNYHYVLWYKEERTILIKHEDYDYHWPSLKSTEIPKWVYFSSINENALDYHDDLVDWLEQNPEVKLAFQPGTFQIKVGAGRLLRLYKRTDVVIMNREEAVDVTGGNYDDMHDLINRLHGLGPKIVCVTDGPAGAYASDGENRLKMPPYPDPAPPLERTGAGDAFSSTFVAALMKGSNIEGALQWGPINSMNVVQNIGARDGLLTEKQLSELLERAPEWYKPERF